MNDEPAPVRVLVVEDNPDHLFFITRALEQFEGARFDVASVRDGAAALDYLFRRGAYTDAPRPHLVILDLRMPKVGGLQVLEQVKGDPQLRSIPVAVLTSSRRDEDIETSYRYGTNTYVVKQFTASGIRDAVAAVGSFWTEVATLPRPPS